MRRRNGLWMAMCIVAASVLASAPGASAATVSEFTLGGGGAGTLGAIAPARDGRLWVTDSGGLLRRVTTGGSEIAPVPLPAGNALDFGVGDDPGFWLLQADGTFARIDLTGPPAWVGGNTAALGTAPQSLALGLDGRLWFADSANRVVGATTTGFGFDELQLPVGDEPADLVAGPDGGIWVTLPSSGAIVRLDPQSPGVAPTESLRVPTGAGSAPEAIAVGADGRLWFADPASNAIGAATTAGVVTTFPLPTAAADPAGVALGPDGAIWFTERAANRVARISTAGVVTEYPLPTPGAQPFAIAAGPDGAMWFTESARSRVGRITTDPDPAAGPQGPSGNDGPPGADGDDGSDGADGRDGAPGADGADGAQGPAGAKGADGAAGAKGADGASGPKGEEGDAGTVPTREPLRASCRTTKRETRPGRRLRVTVTCLVRGSVEGRATLNWRLAYGRRTIARGARTTRTARATFTLPVVTVPRRGRYQLTVTPARPNPPSVRLRV